MKGFISMLGAFEFLNPFSFLIDLVNLIPKLVYLVMAAAMGLLDIAQMLIRKLAGLDVHYNAAGDPQSGDIVLSFLQGIFGSDPNYLALRNAFWSLIILAVILLVVSTIIAVIRQEYMPGQEESKEKPTNTKKHVINRAFKSLFMFMIVPVSVFMGLMFSDAILRAMDSITTGAGSSAIFNVEGNVEDDDTVTYPTHYLVAEPVGDGKTSSYIYYDFFLVGAPTTGTPFSGVGFKAAGFMANRVRGDKTYKTDDGDKTFYQLVQSNDVSNFSIFNYATTKEEMASMIDDAFAGNIKLQTPQHLKHDSAAKSDIKNPILFANLKVESFSKYNVALVWYYYDLWQYNFLVAGAFLVVSLKLVVKIIMGLMKRIIELVALFIVSPPIIALMPLDGGKSFGEWRKVFVSKALGAYGAIIGMNILFLLLPYINRIKFIQENVAFSVGDVNVYYHGAKMVNLLISTLFIIVGLTMVEGMIALMSKIIQPDDKTPDIVKDGGEIAGKVGDTLETSIGRTATAAGAATRIVGAPLTLLGGAANAIGRKATGRSDFSMGKGILSHFSGQNRAARKTASIEKSVTKQSNKSWQKGAGEQAYTDYLKNDDYYKNQMGDAFAQRTDQDMKLDDWLQSEEGTAASSAALKNTLANADVQSKDDFIKAESGAGAEALSNYTQKAIDEKIDKINKGGIVKKSIKGGLKLAQPLTTSMLRAGQGLSAFASDLIGNLEEATGKKGYIKAMKLGFEGKSKKQAEEEKKISDHKKEMELKEKYEKEKSKGSKDEGKSSKEKGGSGGSGGSGDADKGYVKDETNKLKRELEENFERTLDEKLAAETKDLQDQIKKQSEEISKLKKK